jgi:hypothetical protein
MSSLGNFQLSPRRSNAQQLSSQTCHAEIQVSPRTAAGKETDSFVVTRLSVCPRHRIYCCGWPGCNYEAKRMSTLKEHIRTHTRERPFKCPHCCYAAAQRTTLNCHMKRRHSKAKIQRTKMPDVAVSPLQLQTATFATHGTISRAMQPVLHTHFNAGNGSYTACQMSARAFPHVHSARALVADATVKALLFERQRLEQPERGAAQLLLHLAVDAQNRNTSKCSTRRTCSIGEL